MQINWSCKLLITDVTEPVKIRFWQIRILRFKSVGFGCGRGFVIVMQS